MLPVQVLLKYLFGVGTVPYVWTRLGYQVPGYLFQVSVLNPAPTPYLAFSRQLNTDLNYLPTTFPSTFTNLV